MVVSFMGGGKQTEASINRTAFTNGVIANTIISHITCQRFIYVLHVYFFRQQRRRKRLADSPVPGRLCPAFRQVMQSQRFAEKQAGRNLLAGQEK